MLRQRMRELEQLNRMASWRLTPVELEATNIGVDRGNSGGREVAQKARCQAKAEGAG